MSLVTPLATEAVTQAIDALNAKGEMIRAYGNERDELNQMIGRVQLGMALGSFTNAINVQTLAQIKASKTYKSLEGLTGVDRRGLPISNLGTWNGFCRSLGMSPDKADDDILNIAKFGEEAMEHLAAIGAGYRELRQYRRLPEDQRQALIEVAKAGDKEGFAELAEEIISKHLKEKESLHDELAESKAERQATEQLLETKNKRIDQLERAQHRIQTMPPDEAAAELVREATDKMYSAQGYITGHFRAALQALNDAPSIEGKVQLMAGMVGQLMADLHVLRDQFNLPDAVGDGRPEWMQWTEKQESIKAEKKEGSTSIPG